MIGKGVTQYRIVKKLGGGRWVWSIRPKTRAAANRRMVLSDGAAKIAGFTLRCS
jgi:hypothetical protein